MSGVVLAAHGTRSSVGRRCVETIRRELQELLGRPVRLGWVDVCEPHVSDVVRDGDVVLPAFLGAGYHVRVDLPTAVAEHHGVTLTPHLGTDEAVVEALAGRVAEAGGPWPLTIVGWAGSRDERSRDQAAEVTRALARRWQGRAQVVLATPAEIPALVVGSPVPVGVASYLLAPGHFHDRLRSAGAVATTEPLGSHPRIIEALARRVHDVYERPWGHVFPGLGSGAEGLAVQCPTG
ncbi:sirohydrochlorin chelatase [Luteococcus sp. Sow4_B9]|uniref:sirohydrochlorin chelatase n=1 Tax=Luteococcus sp. Sow4_B9 TaxID=3438792 RepID=UPI003F97FD1D